MPRNLPIPTPTYPQTTSQLYRDRVPECQTSVVIMTVSSIWIGISPNGDPHTLALRRRSRAPRTLGSSQSALPKQEPARSQTQSQQRQQICGRFFEAFWSRLS